MDMQTLTTLFMWCTILNGGLLILSFLMVISVGDLAYKIHGSWFPMPRETYNAVLFSFIAIFKMLWLVFNVVPFLALLIIG